MYNFYFVYSLTGPDGRQYIGQTVDLRRRMHEHAFRNSGSLLTPIGDAISKEGAAKFRADVLHICRSSEEAETLELSEIASRKTHLPAFGYNQTGDEISPELSLKRSAARKAYLDSTEGARGNLTDILRERNASPEHRAKVKRAKELYWAKVRSGEIVRVKQKRGPEVSEKIKASLLRFHADKKAANAS